jgi:hypothetical protein
LTGTLLALLLLPPHLLLHSMFNQCIKVICCWYTHASTNTSRHGLPELLCNSSSSSCCCGGGSKC